MIRRSKRRIAVCISLICLNLIVIWGNSLLPGQASAALSQWFQAILQAILPVGEAGVDQGHGLLRKLAHFTEFALLGAAFSWLYAMLPDMRRQRIVLAVVSGFLAACTDEIIQRFVPGRNGNFIDVGIDTAGVVTGIVLFLMLNSFLQSKKP